MDPAPSNEPKSAKELIAHASFQRQAARIKDLGESVTITEVDGITSVSISSETVPRAVAETFVTNLQRIDPKGFLKIVVASQK